MNQDCVLGKDDGIQIEKARVVLTGFEREKDKYSVIKSLAKELACSFEDASEIAEKIPVEIIQPLPMEAAENLASRLRPEGAMIEIVPLSREMGGGRTCYRHPHKLAMAKCKVCGKLVCKLCLIENKGKLFCLEHFHRYKRRRLAKYVSTTVAILVVFLVWVLYQDLIGQMARRMMPLKNQRVALVVFTNNADAKAAEFYSGLMQQGTMVDYREQVDHSFADVDSWYQNQYRQITHDATLDVVDVDIYGLFDMLESPPEFGFAKRSKLSFRNYIKEIASRNAFSLTAYDYFIFVFLVDTSPFAFDTASELGVYEGSYGMFLLPLEQRKPKEYYVAALAHLLGRMMGAKPRYNENLQPEYPHGFAEPMLAPRYPQALAELMGVNIPISPTETKPIQSLDQLVIGLQTAQELRWVTKRFVREASQKAP